ncbi:hypothetical protein JI666_09470 [Bacillus sp. NTK071]|uniref:S-Ena type endospore appendage n=1 Tax=Bacillus sp. NTK071 TaxID=2802175 RepID=UPI001A8F1497|nr:S-Ena type endospore appendage [Bacillus sp. NTK071]MBN8208972.1 hypothetical protein [Bacillus sp. NTK071]
MCESKGNNACCPDGQIFQENFCGNLGPGFDATVWEAPPGLNDYIQGTFEVFNAGTEDILATVTSPNGNVGPFAIPPNTSVSRSAVNPTSFIITVPDNNKLGSKYCITLYKRIF